MPKYTTVYLLRDDETLDRWIYASFEKAKEAYLEYIDGLIEPEQIEKLKAMTTYEDFHGEYHEKDSVTCYIADYYSVYLTDEELIY